MPFVLIAVFLGYTIGKAKIIKKLKTTAKLGSLININNTLYKLEKTGVLDVKKYKAFGDRYFIINVPKSSVLLNNKLKNESIRIRNYIYTIKESFVISKNKAVVLVYEDFKRDIEWPEPPKCNVKEK
jgi:hypothetical protein